MFDDQKTVIFSLVLPRILTIINERGLHRRRGGGTGGRSGRSLRGLHRRRSGTGTGGRPRRRKGG